MTEPFPDSPAPRTTGGNWRWQPPSADVLGAVLSGYEVEKLIGCGGMGAVYKGIQTSLERPVAIKVLPSGIEKKDPTFAERFHHEAKVMARLVHPAVVAVYDFGKTDDGMRYFVMEYVDGTDIQGLLASQGRLPAEHALAITAHVCDALAAAHHLGIVHRDIKPSNVLINSEGKVKVADFGLAKIDDPSQHGLTRTGYALGTPDYVAPESLILGARVDGRADLYAVGVMLYQMLTGDLPKGAWKLPSAKVTGLDPRFDDIVVRARQSDPGDRYPSSAELRRDLDVILTVPLVRTEAPQSSALPRKAVAEVAGQRSAAPVKARPRGPRSAPPRKQKPKGRGLLVGGIAAGLVLIGGAIAYLASNDGGDPVATVPRSLEAEVAKAEERILAPPTRSEPTLAKPSSESSPPATEPVANAPKPAETTAPPAPTKVAEKTSPNSQALGRPAREESPENATSAPAATTPPEPAPAPAPVPREPKSAADLLAEAKEKGGKLRTWGFGPNGPFDVGEAVEFDDFVQVSATHFGWAARRADGQLYGGFWGNDPARPYTRVGPFETTYLSRAALINMILTDGTSRNVFSGSSFLFSSNPEKSDRVIAVLNHVIRLDPDGTQNWSYGTPDPTKSNFFAGATTITGTLDYFIRHQPGQPVASWIAKNGTDFTFSEDTKDTIAMDGGQHHVILLDSKGKVQVWNEDGTAIDDPALGRLPAEPGPYVDVRAGSQMFAAQRTDGTWAAWGNSEDLAAQIGKLGMALDLDLYHDEKATFAMWIEPPAVTAQLTLAASIPEDVAQRLAEIDAQFQAAYDRDIAPAHAAAIADLDGKYLAAVKRALDAAAGAGRLDESVLLRAEVQRIEKQEPLPDEDAGDLPETLQKLRGTYRESLSKLESDRVTKAKPYFERRGELLDAYQNELTKQGRLDDALKVRTHRERPHPGSSESPASGVPAKTPAPAPVASTSPGTSSLKLPQWLEAAAESGGKLRIWGQWDGKPIDEREALKEFRESDYTQVMAGHAGMIMGVNRQNQAKALKLDPTDSRFRLAEYRRVSALDRRTDTWISDGRAVYANAPGAERELGPESIVTGGSANQLVRLASGEWLALGLNWNRPGNELIQPLMKQVCGRLATEKARLVSNIDGDIIWVNAANQVRKLRVHRVQNGTGTAEEDKIDPQPSEAIISVINGAEGSFGYWLALSESGKVHAATKGGFKAAVAELSPAMALRYDHGYGGGRNRDLLAAQKPDGTWHALGTETDLASHIATIPPCIDLDIFVRDDKNQFVLWIEPDSSLAPR